MRGSSDRPRVTIYTAVSLDGRIGFRGRRFVLGTCEQRILHHYRSVSDAVMVGAGTVISDNPSLTVRLVDYKGGQPLRVVVDGRLSTPIDAKVYDTSMAPTLVVTSEASPWEKRRRLEEKGVEVVVAGPGPWIDIGFLLSLLWRRGVRSLLVEGGATLIGELVSAMFFDRLVVAVTPWLLGSGATGFLEKRLVEPVRLRVEEIRVCGVDVVLELRPLTGSL